jgi:hypothetical protein
MNILPAASTSFLIDALNRGGVDRVISSLYGLQYAPSDSSSSDDDSDTSSSEWDDDADDASYSSLSSASSVSSEDSFHRVFKSHFDGDEDETGLFSVTDDINELDLDDFSEEGDGGLPIELGQ